MGVFEIFISIMLQNITPATNATSLTRLYFSWYQNHSVVWVCAIRTWKWINMVIGSLDFLDVLLNLNLLSLVSFSNATCYSYAWSVLFAHKKFYEKSVSTDATSVMHICFGQAVLFIRGTYQHICCQELVARSILICVTRQDLGASLEHIKSSG